MYIKNAVLVMCDDEASLNHLTGILDKEYTVSTAKNDGEFIEKMAACTPDLIILDARGTDVFDMSKTSVPVIFIADTGAERAPHIGANVVDYIQKPYNTDILRMRVANQIKIISLRRELENALSAANTANKSKMVFFANMSHEIRTPMNGIMGISSILMNRDNLPPDVYDALSKIYTSSDMLLNMLTNILDLTQIESGRLEIKPCKYEVASMINDAMHNNISYIKKKPIQFELEIDEGMPAALYGDMDRLRQILSNLLSNAFKYTDEGKVVLKIGYTPAAEGGVTAEDGIILELGVRDTGSGMTEEQIAVLFDDYSRFAERDNGAGIKGVGFGMAIAHRLANLMNAEMIVDSKPGEGSNFTVRLFQKIADKRVLGKEVADKLRSFNYTTPLSEMGVDEYVPMPHGRVLIVDDVELNLYVAAGVMEPYGMEIDLASSGREAIEKIENGNTYHVIFMDYMMPQLNGVETTRRLRSMGYAEPIVALTADTVTGNAKMFMDNGFNKMITKPINVREVDKILHKYVKNK